MTDHSPEEQPITSHGINDSRHWEKGAQQAHCQSCYRADGDDELSGIESVGYKHFHQRGFSINGRVRHHQS